MATSPRPQPVLPAPRSRPLHAAAAGRAIERDAAARLPPHTLMARAGEAVARLALAVAPHARAIELWCGPGNNGGDGFIAATLLRQWGKDARVVVAGDATRRPDDARHAWQRACDAGVPVATAWPERIEADLVIDALLGVGLTRALDGVLADAVQRVNAAGTPVLAVDLPSGLHSDSGAVMGVAVRARHTLSLLTLKPGLFTAHGRDHAGRIWFDDLSVAAAPSDVELAGADVAQPWSLPRQHAQHKGSFGDVAVIGGASGMVGAALLAARATLAAGAGRVYVGLLAEEASHDVDGLRPELMWRPLRSLLEPRVLDGATVVCGCGGGDAVRGALPVVLHHARRLVLDADALNQIAADAALARVLRARAARSLASVLTPHPLEAARLLGSDSHDVQRDRIAAARALADQAQCTVLLKGSGTIVASPGHSASITPTGDARLGTAGSGDVLAGWLGGLWAAQAQTTTAHRVAQAAAWLHGAAVEFGPRAGPLRASELIDAIAAARDALSDAR